MKPLSDNAELYKYLLGLEDTLRTGGSVDLADAVAIAGRHASGMSTEFLGETRIALRQVATHGQDVLSEQERMDLLDVLRQLDTAFNRR